jgi:hypothetical protein
VKKVKEILLHPSLKENTEVLIAIGQKDNFNDPSDIQKLLKFIDEESTKIKTTKPVRFICPTNNFHIKTYCFLGRRVKDDKEIGFSIIGSSNLTWSGLKCEGELCISIHHLNLTKELIYRLSKKYSNSPQWNQKIRAYEIKYKEHSRKDQNEVLPIPNRQDGKFIELGVLTDSVLLAKATNLTNYSDNIHCFHSHQTVDEEKNDVPQGSLCLLLTENKIFRIVEIRSHSSYQENPEGCFVTYKENVTYQLSEDICEILKKEKYKIIYNPENKIRSNPENMEKLPYDTLKDFENEVKEYQKILADPNYRKGLEKAKEKMQSEIDRLFESESDLISMKEQLKKIIQSI